MSPDLDLIQILFQVDQRVIIKRYKILHKKSYLQKINNISHPAFILFSVDMKSNHQNDHELFSPMHEHLFSNVSYVIKL